MAVTTHIDQARTRVATERDAVAAKHEAFDRFVARVSDLSAEPTPGSASRITATAGARLGGDTSDDRCRAVRTAFEETVCPHCVADGEESESLLATIRIELTDTIAVALAPTSDTSFTPNLKRTVVAEANARQTETDVFRRALDREAAHLDAAGDVVDDITAWIAEADETPLTDLDFETLAQRHGTLADHRERCERLAQRRQEFLDQTTSTNAEAGIRHRSLVFSLYQDFPVDHPVLATVARLDAACEECQRAVRDHLVRRV